MFADCNVDENQHVLIDEIVDHKSDGSACWMLIDLCWSQGKQPRDGSYV